MNTKKLTISLAIFLVCGLAIVGITLAKEIEANKYYNILTYSELIGKLKEDDSFPLLITKDDCSYCESFIPKVKKVSLEYEIIIYNINLSELSDDEVITFDKSFSITGTPTLIFINNGEETYIKNRIIGNVLEKTLINTLEINNYVK